MSSEFSLQPADLRRVNVVGVSGSGKSWLAARLAETLGSTYVQMDQLYWGPNWTESEVGVFRDKIRATTQADRWVLDGNYHSKTHDIKWAAATLVVWVDHPFGQTMWQAVSRAVHRAWRQDELWPGTGNRESFRRSFCSTESVVLWTLMMYRPARRRYLNVQATADERPFRFVRLRGRRSVDRFLQAASEQAASFARLSHDAGPADKQTR